MVALVLFLLRRPAARLVLGCALGRGRSQRWRCLLVGPGFKILLGSESGHFNLFRCLVSFSAHVSFGLQVSFGSPLPISSLLISRRGRNLETACIAPVFQLPAPNIGLARSSFPPVSRVHLQCLARTRLQIRMYRHHERSISRLPQLAQFFPPQLVQLLPPKFASILHFSFPSSVSLSSVSPLPSPSLTRQTMQ